MQTVSPQVKEQFVSTYDQAIATGLEKGMQQGLEKGMQQGLEKGRKACNKPYLALLKI